MSRSSKYPRSVKFEDNPEVLRTCYTRSSPVTINREYVEPNKVKVFEDYYSESLEELESDPISELRQKFKEELQKSHSERSKTVQDFQEKYKDFERIQEMYNSIKFELQSNKLNLNQCVSQIKEFKQKITSLEHQIELSSKSTEEQNLLEVIKIEKIIDSLETIRRFIDEQKNNETVKDTISTIKNHLMAMVEKCNVCHKILDQASKSNEPIERNCRLMDAYVDQQELEIKRLRRTLKQYQDQKRVK